MNDSRTTDTQTPPKLGLLGLGQMGGAMTPTLLKAGYPVIAYDPAAELLVTGGPGWGAAPEGDEYDPER